MFRILLFLLIVVFCHGPSAISVAQTRRTDSPEVLKALLALPAPTPRHAATATKTEEERPAEFYFPKNRPPDDAPIEDLLAYWTRWANDFDPKDLTDAVRKRLFDACLESPQILPIFLRLLPVNDAASAKLKELYDGAQNDERLDEEWRRTIKHWLLYNSTYFLDELTALAQKAKDDVNNGEITRKEALTALAKLDWSNAEPILRGLLVSGQPRSSAFALSLFYRHAVDEKDLSSEERYRNELISISSNRNQPAFARDTAIRALSSGDWSGRDEWYTAQFQDVTLLELSDEGSTFSPLTAVFQSDTEKWTPIMTRLLESKDINVRSAAASCLLALDGEDARKDVLLPLLPWLSDPAWLKETSNRRLQLIQRVGSIDMPESIPGLIAIVEGENFYSSYEQSYAAKSLARYKDPRAVPGLKKALAKEQDENQRNDIIEGLLASNGLTETEQLQALEAYASKLTTDEGRIDMLRYRMPGEEQLTVQLSIGRYFANATEVPEALVNAVLVRAENLKSENPSLAQELIKIAHTWQGSNVDRDLIRRIANGSADAGTIHKAFERKPKFHESLRTEIQSLSAASGAAQGVGAVLLEDSGLAQGILTSRDQVAQIALLASARLIQMPLPIELVSPLLRSKNSLLALAAEVYLLAEDSREARDLLWQHHPNEAFVTGWRENLYFPAAPFESMNKIEKDLKAELFKENGPTEILGLLSHDEHSRWVLRIYADKAVFTTYEDAARYQERTVSKAEVSALKDFLTTKNLSDRGPTIEFCHHGCPPSEFLFLTKEKGRRVYNQVGFGELLEIYENFRALGNGPGAKTHYNLEKDIKGLEVLYGDSDFAIHDISQQGSELRVFVERPSTEAELKEQNALYENLIDEGEPEVFTELRQRVAEQEKARFSWRILTNNQPGAITSQPSLYSNFDGSKFVVEEDGAEVDGSDPQVQVIGPNSIVFAQYFEGLWRQDAGTKPVRLSSEGTGYSNPIVTPDGKWIVVSKSDTDASEPSYIVRYNLQTGREFRVKLDPADEFYPIAFVATHNKVVLHRAKHPPSVYTSDSVGPDKPEYYLLDPYTGAARLVSGEFEPLTQRGPRSLQRTGKPDEFWVALPDDEKNRTRVGRYNTRDFSFTLVMEVPHIVFNSMAMWVDANQAKVYLVYKNQLLRLPLQAAAPVK